MNKKKLLSGLFFFCVYSGIAQEIRNTEDLLRANLAATGGIDNWLKVQAIELKENSVSGPIDFKQTTHRIKKFPGYVYSKSITDNPRLYLETVVTGTPDKLVQSTMRGDKTEYKDINRFESYLSASTELNMLEDKNYLLGPLGSDTLEDGTICWGFDVTYGQFGPIRRYYNKKTFLLQALTTTSRSTNSDTVTTIIKKVLEHKTVNGLLFPSKISFVAGQQNNEFVQTIESITLNPTIDNKIFNMEYVAN